ncbi:MAG: glutamine synthetase beta-grasp domain-containing protein [Candidatus Marinimicrobia bacterium]|nr:glutamine synthetase beta-grasp domain-containing protein [Candidatus Neomarinimicrobiota bacterium]MBL7060188.1 glutamine synthetase beta-grasp domain-containing protein [Candidatus Neomarinimicrobiota bacterium]
MSKIMAEYIWIDGHQPTQKLRSKTKIIDGPITDVTQVPKWGFDGSSTRQAEGNHSDCLLYPVYLIQDPIRGGENVLIMCEVFNPDGTPHESNRRAGLRHISEQYKTHEPLFGIEQEYTLFQGRSPLGWPDGGYPAPQGPFYCGVGSDEVFGRELVEEHLELCLEAGLGISGINAEVMPGQWEFQVGPLAPLEVSDEVWLARWLLYRIGEDYGVSATLHPKPVKGDWNGAGAHANFSTKTMREDGGLKFVKEACKKLGKKHKEHIAVYGAHNEERLTGLHETCSIDDYRYGVSDRGASVRIPMITASDGKGYLEDRRPAANMDPYVVCAKLIETVCEE